eukprot:6351767-Prymnesium_polylepis.1
MCSATPSLLGKTARLRQPIRGWRSSISRATSGASGADELPAQIVGFKGVWDLRAHERRPVAEMHMVLVDRRGRAGRRRCAGVVCADLVEAPLQTAGRRVLAVHRHIDVAPRRRRLWPEARRRPVAARRRIALAGVRDVALVARVVRRHFLTQSFTQEKECFGCIVLISYSHQSSVRPSAGFQFQQVILYFSDDPGRPG